MNYLHANKSWKKFSLIIFSLLIALISSATPISAETTSNSSNTQGGGGTSNSSNTQPKGGTGNGTPTNNTTKTAGGQGEVCASTAQAKETVSALVPDKTANTLTVESHPTFWFYIPYQANGFHSMEFILRNPERKKIYTSAPKQSNKLPGVISITVPQTVTPLEINKTHKIQFIVYCKNPQAATSGGNNMLLNVFVTRTAMTGELKKQLEAAKTPQEKASVYTKNGIWLDAITTLANSHRTDKNNTAINTAWVSLLTNLGFSDVASKPIVDDSQSLSQPSSGSGISNGRRQAEPQ